MQLDANQLVALGQILKAAQEKKPEKRKRQKSDFSAAYPRYDRSLASQMKTDPVQAGVVRGAGTGAVGAILGAVIARIISNRPEVVGGGAVLGGLVGAIPGYRSGKHEALSDYSRLLYLRRLGITRPGELEAATKMPELTERVTQEGTEI